MDGVNFKSLLVAVGCLVLILSYNHCSVPTPATYQNSLGSIGGSNNQPPGGTAGALEFQNKVLPQFNSRCATCHTEPRFGGVGPLTIFGYTAMKAKLANGPSGVNNELVNKMQNLTSHFGGNQCPAGLGASPCKEVVDWWQTEYNAAVGGTTGIIESVDALGGVLGWAKDANNPNAIVTVFLYANGPIGTGTFITSLPANQPGPGGPGAGHYFVFTLPANLRNGQMQSLYIYGIEAQPANLLAGSPKSFVSYIPKAAGMAYYEGTLKPLLQNRCASCHGNATYNAHYVSLISPAPSMGGTALNNTLINKPSASVTHGGGNVCGGKNGSPCLQIQQWWNLEFQ